MSRELRRRWIVHSVPLYCILAAIAVTVQQGEASDYAGANRCAPCHKTEYGAQSASHHAHSLTQIAGSLVGATLLKDGRSPDGQVQYEAAKEDIAARAASVPDSAMLEWAFGAGVQGSTPVGRVDGQYFEHRFSYYSRIRDLALTFGHPAKANSPTAELGIPQDNLTISRCFNCHSTGVQRSTTGPDLTGMTPGVQCERCHGPGTSHIQEAETSASREAIVREIANPGRLPAKAQIEICGQCHRLPGPDAGDRPELENPVAVRFAPIGLLASRCFQGSKAISCLTCHDPHRDVAPSTDFSYSAKCLSCHASDTKPVKVCRRRNQENCLPCHMKQTEVGRYLRFTDHRIRVYE